MPWFLKLFLWWLTFSALWGIYRLFPFPESFSELIAKPVVWLGVTGVFLWLRLIPSAVIEDLKKNFLQTRPFWKIFLLPVLFTGFYFLVINWRQISVPTFSWWLLISVVAINFATGIVEEIVYRGVMYVWLLKQTNEAAAFVIVQLLFVLGHVPTLIVNSPSVTSALSHAFFIVLIGSIHTLIFRLTKSLYASSATHGLWNSLAHYFLLS